MLDQALPETVISAPMILADDPPENPVDRSMLIFQYVLAVTAMGAVLLLAIPH